MSQSNIIMYTTEDGLTKIEATFDEDTVWLSIDQMAELFQRDKSTISRHIKNIFSEGELFRSAVVAKFATTAADGKTYQVEYYNLDVIISVGYRVKSLRGTQIRRADTEIAKNYLTQPENFLLCKSDFFVYVCLAYAYFHLTSHYIRQKI
ncbi:MAG: virulence RhuM family protein [Lachnospiraceae bacterium]|nr:virulence RhuM family protein [Lachnospiraceae bacterium]